MRRIAVAFFKQGVMLVILLACVLLAFAGGSVFPGDTETARSLS